MWMNVRVILAEMVAFAPMGRIDFYVLVKMVGQEWTVVRVSCLF